MDMVKVEVIDGIHRAGEYGTGPSVAQRVCFGLSGAHRVGRPGIGTRKGLAGGHADGMSGAERGPQEERAAPQAQAQEVVPGSGGQCVAMP